MKNINENIKNPNCTSITVKDAKNYRDLIKYARDVIFTLSPDGTITSLNPAFENLLGWSCIEWIGKSYMSIVHPDDLPLAIDIHQRTLKGDKIDDFELRILKKSGEYLTFDFIITPLINGVGGLGIARDITERKKIDKALQNSEAEYRNLIENIQDGVIVIQDSKIQFASKTFVESAGYTMDDVIGKQFCNFIAPESLKTVSENYYKRQAGENVPKDYEFNIIHKDHKTRTILDATFVLITYRNRVATMVTVRNNNDRKKLERQLFRAQRMESLGTLAGGIAHDLNNMLTPILLSLQLLKERVTDQQSQKLLNILENNSKRSANLIKQVMLFARGADGEYKPLYVAHIIYDFEKVIKQTFNRNIEIQSSISKDLWPIYGDNTQLHQLMMNLCVNARDAMPNGGKLTISADNFYIDESYSRMCQEARVGKYIIITIADTGIGIPPEILDKIFDPFFTTKDIGKGTGLGLSISLGIVKSHKGFLEVQSEVDKGTTFKIYLPAILSDIEKLEKIVKFPTGNGELILVADDEISIREITCSTLEAYGYNVLSSEDGADTLALYAENKDKVKVIIMDLMMPILDGPTSIRIIRKINPEIKIIAISGLADGDKLLNTLDSTVDAFLQKPFTADDLLNIIHEVITKCDK